MGDQIIKILLKEIGWTGVKWINLAQDKYRWQVLAKTVMDLRVHKRLEFLDCLSDYQLLVKDSATWS
jgi:hypothetical protein